MPQTLRLDEVKPGMVVAGRTVKATAVSVKPNGRATILFENGTAASNIVGKRSDFVIVD